MIYATCFGNDNGPDIGVAARAVLAANGVETEIVYPACCGMPHLETGDIAGVAGAACAAAAELLQRSEVRDQRSDFEWPTSVL